jgi:hypothetical protein
VFYEKDWPVKKRGSARVPDMDYTCIRSGSISLGQVSDRSTACSTREKSLGGLPHSMGNKNTGQLVSSVNPSASFVPRTYK